MSIFGGKKPTSNAPGARFVPSDVVDLHTHVGISNSTGGLLSGNFGAAQQAQLSREYLDHLQEEILREKVYNVRVDKQSYCMLAWREVEGGYLVKYSTREGEAGKEVLCATLDDVSKIVFRATAEKALA